MVVTLMLLQGSEAADHGFNLGFGKIVLVHQLSALPGKVVLEFTQQRVILLELFAAINQLLQLVRQCFYFGLFHDVPNLSNSDVGNYKCPYQSGQFTTLSWRAWRDAGHPRCSPGPCQPFPVMLG